jgi:hypothetical protein
MKYLTIEKTNNGYIITNTITNKQVYYTGYSLKQALKKYSKDKNENYKQLKKAFT